MAIRHSATTVDTTVGGVPVLSTTIRPKSSARADKAWTVQLTNAGAVVVYFGDQGVTSSSYAFSLAANATITLELYPGDTNLYALAASSTASVKVGYFGAA